MNNQLPLQIDNLDGRFTELSQVFQNISTGNLQQAEQYLMSRRFQFDHILVLLEYVLQRKGSIQTTVAALIELKNIFYYNYLDLSLNVNDSNRNIIEYFKNSILKIYFTASSTEKTILQISYEILTVIIKYDIPNNWPGFYNIVIESFKQQQHILAIRAFKLLRKITRKFSKHDRSDDLFLEIIHFMENLFEPVNAYLSFSIQQILQSQMIFENVLILDYIMKIIKNLTYHDIPQNIIDNLQIWVQGFKTILSDEFQNKLKIQCNNTQEQEKLNKACFKLKSHSVSVVVHLTQQYKEDFEDYVKEFMEQIWTGCLNLYNDQSKVDEEMIAQSIQFLNSFSSSELYESFFKSKISEVVMRVILPSLQQDKEMVDIYLDEPEAFSQKLFIKYRQGNKVQQKVTFFVENLAKLYTEDMLRILSMIFEEVIGNRDIKNETVFINLFILTVTAKRNTINGTLSVYLSQQNIQFIYNELIDKYLQQFLQNQIQMQNIENQLYLICHFMKFAFYFNNFLNQDQVLQRFSELFVKTYHLQYESYQKSLIILMQTLFYRIQFKLIDNLNIPVQDMPLYKRLFNQSRVLKIDIQKNEKRKPIRLYFQAEQIQQMNSVLGTMSQTILKDSSLIDKNVIALTLKAIRQINPNEFVNYEQNFFQFCIFYLQLIKDNKIPQNMDLVINIFGYIQEFIYLSRNTDFTQIEQIMIQILSKNNVPINSLIYQIFSLIIKIKNCNIQDNKIYMNLLQSTLNKQNYDQENIAACESYFIFIKECLIKDNSLFNKYWTQIQEVLKFVLSQKFIKNYYKFLNDLIIMDVPIQNIIEMQFYGLSSALQGNQNANFTDIKDNYFQQVLFLEFLYSISFVLAKYNFKTFYQCLIQINANQIYNQFIISEQFKTFIENLTSFQYTSFIILNLAESTLLENEIYVNNQMQDQFLSIVNGIFNLFINKKSGMPRNNISSYKAQREQNKELNKQTLNNYLDIAILNHCKWQQTNWKNEYLREKLGGIKFPKEKIIEMFIQFAQINNINNYAQIIQNQKASELFKQLY